MPSEGSSEREIFEAALDIEPSERRAWLDARCLDAPQLKDRVWRLLEAHEASFATADFVDSAPASDAMPDRIGAYHVLDAIGEGGMGIVYAAEQRTPVRRRVAVKLVRDGVANSETLARFELERNAMALMNHPNIAQMIDAGETARGCPFFVMEYVPGTTITSFCDAQRLDTRERIELLIATCDGVQHAHQKGIIHRDLKPSNVLVTERDGAPMPKVIDFGVAKALEAPLTEQTLHTQLGGVVGTPSYMSPEQADIGIQGTDTRSDVYSLGVLLYELMTGTVPFDVDLTRGLMEFRRQLVEDQPEVPSTRIRKAGETSTHAAASRRAPHASALANRLRGELDWITMRALEKEPSRRYASAQALGDDLRRYLDDLPVNAGPPSLAYRVSKFVRRHRAGVAAAIVAVIALVAGITGLGIGIVRAIEAEATAKAEASTAERVIAFLIDMFTEAKPGEKRDGTTTAREILALGAERIEDELLDQPLVRARLLHTLGEVSESLGLYEDAIILLEGARSLRIAELGEVDPAVGETLLILGRAHRKQADFENAFAHYDAALRIADANGDLEARRRGLEFKGIAYTESGDSKLGEPLLRESLALAERLHGQDSARVANVLTNLGLALQYQSRYPESEQEYLRAIAILERLHGPDHYDLAQGLTGLGIAYAGQRRFPEAADLFRRALANRESVLGEDHPDLATVLGNLANVLQDMREYEQAEPMLLRVLAIREATLGDHPDTASVLVRLGLLARTRKDWDKAQRLVTRAQAIRSKTLGEKHPDTISGHRSLAMIALGRGDNEAAERLLLRTIELREDVSGPNHVSIGYTSIDIAELYRKAGRLEDAREFYERAKRVLIANDLAESRAVKAAEWGLNATSKKPGAVDR